MGVGITGRASLLEEADHWRGAEGKGGEGQHGVQREAGGISKDVELQGAWPGRRLPRRQQQTSGAGGSSVHVKGLFLIFSKRPYVVGAVLMSTCGLRAGGAGLLWGEKARCCLGSRDGVIWTCFCRGWGVLGGSRFRKWA